MIRTSLLIRKDHLFSIYLDSDRISKVVLPRGLNKSLRNPTLCRVEVYWNIATSSLLGQLLKLSTDERFTKEEQLFFIRCYETRRDNFIKASTLLKVGICDNKPGIFGLGREIEIFLQSLPQ